MNLRPKGGRWLVLIRHHGGSAMQCLKWHLKWQTATRIRSERCCFLLQECCELKFCKDYKCSDSTKRLRSSSL